MDSFPLALQKDPKMVALAHSIANVLEREVFLDDTNANCIWTHYADCPDGILAYRVVIEGIRDGKLAGKIIPLDYAKQVQRVIKSALPIVKIQYRDKDDSFCENSYHAFMNSSMPYDEAIHDIRYVPESEAELQHILMLEHRMEQKTKRRCISKNRRIFAVYSLRKCFKGSA